MPDDLVTLTIDDKPVQVPKGTLLVEAAKTVGIDIPIFCYHPKMKPVGACRMCLVEIEKMPRLQTACSTPVAAGMVVHTSSANATAAQKGVIEFLLGNHPLDCPICDKGGECPLQENTFKWGRGISRFEEDKRRLGKAIPLSDRIVLDRERCIMCYRCVRFQDEVAGDGALAVISRGGMSQIGVLEGETFDSPFSGNTIDICPVGALTSRQYRFRSRPWDLRRTPSICVGCGVGCNVQLHSREGQVKRMVPRENMDVNNEWLCDHGRFDTLPMAVERLRESSVDGQAVPWETAVRAAAERLLGDSFEMVASPAITNEALNVLKAIADARNARLTVWPARTGRVRGTIRDLVASKTIILSELNAWTELPVLALRIREALKQGAKLYFVGRKPNGLQRDAVAAFGSIQELLAAKLELAGPISVLGAGAESLATQMEATGLVGSPALAANGAAMADLPAADFKASSLLLVGNEDWPVPAGASVVSLRWTDPHPNPVPEGEGPPGTRHPALGTRHPAPGTVLLPIAHPYEQSGSVTNLEGRVQTLRPGPLARGGERADWLALTELATVLGASPSAGPAPRETALA
ncbi:MAG: (2Fe-2S)-binding protein [Chloroflexota bacterium]|nr:(2Fe-2S)-binding protein [Chloroflexota bacterium]